VAAQAGVRVRESPQETGWFGRAKMSDVLVRVQALAERGQIKVSKHGLRELAKRDIFLDDVVAGVAEGKTVEEYPNYIYGPTVLVLQMDAQGRPLHVLWGIAEGTSEPAVIVTAYRPDSTRWMIDFLERRKQ
jgi:hypothetical protein